MRSTLKRAGIVVAVLVGVMAAGSIGQPSTNLPIDSTHTIGAQPGTSSALTTLVARSCGDCHSNTIESRWYTRVPPFSMVLARAATEGRKALNFSEWTRYPPPRQRDLLLASCTDVTTGKMPGKTYLVFRREAQLSDADVATVCSAAASASSTSARMQAR